jgi:hypothetical protein
MEVGAELAAVGRVRLPVGQLTAWRRQPSCPAGINLPVGFLKQSDEQTVACLAAIFEALAQAGMPADSLDDWGVLASPRFLSRSVLAGALSRFKEEGAWGVSPHLIPHRSLHSLSGTLSHALKMHGPNFGVGEVGEAFAAAFALLTRSSLAGIWVVLSSLDPDSPPDHTGQPSPDALVQGVALGLTARPGPEGRVRLRYAGPERTAPLARPVCRVEDVVGVLDLLQREPQGRTTCLLDLGSWGRVSWHRSPAAGPPSKLAGPHRLAPSAFPSATEVQP